MAELKNASLSSPRNVIIAGDNSGKVISALLPFSAA